MNARALTAFRDTFSGEVIVPGDPGYDDARKVWNGMVDRRPALVVRPIGTAEVVTALRVGREQGLPIAIRGGGHSIPGLSTCDDGIVIDLSAMRAVDVDPERGIARVEGGALLGQLDAAAQAHGLVCPVGVVGHTGVAGLTLGGGMGRLQRRFGLTIDNLQSVELVTADGLVVRASAEENQELFWALRGAGANFGVATSFEYRLHPFDGVVTHGRITHPIEQAGALAMQLRETLGTASNELWASFAISHDGGQPMAQVGVLHSGSAESADRELGPLRAFGPPVEETIQMKPYLETQSMSDDAMGWGHRYSMKSAFFRDLSEEAVDRFVEHVADAPEGCSIGLWACGGVIADVPEEATAFTGRDAGFWVAAEAQWEDPALDAAYRAWPRTAIDDLQPFATVGRYVNDVAEVGDDMRSVYGDAKYDRLVALKREWDPDNVFRLNQNIEP